MVEPSKDIKKDVVDCWDKLTPGSLKNIKGVLKGFGEEGARVVRSSLKHIDNVTVSKGKLLHVRFFVDRSNTLRANCYFVNKDEEDSCHNTEPRTARYCICCLECGESELHDETIDFCRSCWVRGVDAPRHVRNLIDEVEKQRNINRGRHETK